MMPTHYLLWIVYAVDAVLAYIAIPFKELFQ